MEEDRHVSLGLLSRFLTGTATPEQASRVVVHFLRGCPSCSMTARVQLAEIRARQKAFSFTVGGQYDDALARVFAFGSREEKRIALEDLHSLGQWSLLEPLGPEERESRVRGDVRFQTWGLYKHLQDVADKVSRADPARASEIARLAIVVLELLDRELVAGEACRKDFLAEAWAKLGNAQRQASDLAGARAAFQTARELAAEGSGEPLTRALLVVHESSWIANQGDFEGAVKALETARRIYRRIGDNHQQGRVLLKMGDFLGHIDTERGISHILRALPLIDKRREPRLELCAQHDLIHQLNDAGRPQQALAALEQARPLYRQFPDDYTQFRLRWLEGKIARRLARPEEAEQTFRSLAEEFRDRNFRHDLVLVSLELAETHLESGETVAAAKLVKEIVPIAEELGLDRYVRAARRLVAQPG